MTGSPNRRQYHYRFRTDTGTIDATPTWGANEDTTYVPLSGANLRVRFLVWNDGTATTGNQSWSLYYQKNGTGSFAAVTTTSTVVKAVDAGSSADNTSLATQRLTSPASGTFVAGQYDETGATGTIAITTGNFSEFEFGIQFVTADLTNGDYVKLRVYAGGSALQAYDVEPQIYPSVPKTITSPVGGVTIAGVIPAVASGGSVTSPAASISLAAASPTISASVSVPGIFDSGIFDTGIFDHQISNITINSPSKTVTIAGVAPSVVSGGSAIVPAGNVTIAGVAPGVSSGGSATVPAAAIAIAGVAPGVVSGGSAIIPVATVALAGVAPSVVSGGSVAVPVANTDIAGVAPSVFTGASVTAPAGEIAVEGVAPAIFSGATIDVPAKDIAVEGNAPNILVGSGISVPPGVVAIDPVAPTIAAGKAIAVPAAEVQVSAAAPSVSTGKIIYPPAANVDVAANAPTVATAAIVTIPAAGLTIAGVAPSIFVQSGGATGGRDGGTDDAGRLNRLRLRAALLAKQAAELAEKDKPKAKSVKAAAKKVVETLEEAREAGGALLSDEYVVMLDQLIIGLRVDFLGPTVDIGKLSLLATQAQAVAAVVSELLALQRDEEEAIAALLMAA